jgi:hypothetical protein
LYVDLSLQNYSWDIHSLLATAGKPPSLAYILSWKYIIYLLAIKTLIENGAQGNKLTDTRKVIESVYTFTNT